MLATYNIAVISLVKLARLIGCYQDGSHDERDDGDDDHLPSSRHIGDDSSDKAAEDGSEGPA